jgi:oligopeptidase B
VSAPPVAPIAKRIARALELHGERLDDPYHWLRERDDPAVRAHLEAENAYAEAVTARLAPLREELGRELRARLAEDDRSAPYRKGAWLYSSRTERGKQHRIYVRHRDPAGPDQVLLDLNELAGAGRYIALGDFEVSDDGRLLAYTVDRRGFREYTLEVLDLETGALLPERIERVTSVAWAADAAGARTLLYATEDAAKRPWRVRRHELGSEPSGAGDPLVFDEPDERFRVGVERTRSGALLVITSASHTASEVRLLDAARPEDLPRLVEPRVPDHEYYVDDAGDRLVVRSNRAGRNFALYEAPLASPGAGSWRELLAHDPDTMLERVDAFAAHLVVTERHLGLPRFRILPTRPGAASEERSVAFPEPAYDAAPGPNAEFRAASFRYTYQSMTTPPSAFDVDFATAASFLVKRDPVPGYDPALYVTERRFARAADGTRIPISLVRRRDTPLPAPTLLKGYGAYGISYPAAFDRNAVSLLNRGLVVAIAHVRGGGDLGQGWHDAGRMAAKTNTFTDFVAVAEELLARGVAAPGRLALLGGSAGGLLVGAVLNARPDLFAAAIALVPFVDVVGTMSDASLPLTVGEYEEWGNPAIEEQYRWMRAYSPYHNLAAREYPAILVRTSFWDSQVMYWEPAKYVARLRTLKRDRRPLLLVTNLDAGGHGGFAGRYDRLRDTAFDFAFLLDALGLA